MSKFDTFHAKRQAYIQPPAGAAELPLYASVDPETRSHELAMLYDNSYAQCLLANGGATTSGGFDACSTSGGFGSWATSGGWECSAGGLGTLAASGGRAGLPRHHSHGQSPLRVIHVTTCAAQGGIEQWLQSLMKFADPSRLKFVRCVVTGDCVDPQVAKGYRVPLEFGGKESVLRACRDCDVLLISDPAGIATYAHELDPPVCVMVAHGDGHWTRSRLHWMSPAIDHVVAVSELVKQIVCDGFPTTVIHNGVDAGRLAASMGRDAARAKFGFRSDDFVLGWCGRFSEEKNPFAIIEAIARLPANFKALLVGFGYLRPELMDLANERIPGRYAVVRRDDYLGDVYQAMDAFSLTSFSEGFGLVLAEAMMCRLPIISTPVGLVHDVVVDRVNGLVVDGEPDSIRDAALQLQSRPAWREAIAREGFRWADQNGHASKMAQAYADLLWSLWHARAAKAS